MTCCFSGREIPISKLLVLYYPPAMAHQEWDHSAYAAARAGEALRAIEERLRSFYRRYVLGKRLAVGIGAAVLGAALAVVWAAVALASWSQAGFLQRYLLPLGALLSLLVGASLIRGFFRRNRIWKERGQETVARELAEIEKAMKDLPDDPTADQAALILRRSCPDVISELAFEGTYFRAFTYMDFVMFPQLRHPASRDELPDKHSLTRDAYYVGDVVYDGWRMFQKDLRELVDPRFAGSGGRRGVI